MSNCKWALLGISLVQGNPFSSGNFREYIIISDEENGVLRCCTAVALPEGCYVLQMLPGPLLINLAGVSIAGNQAAGDEAHRWAILHRPWIVVEDTAPLLGISS